MDEHNQQKIAKLHPKVRKEVTLIVEECNQTLTGRAQLRITQGLRTLAEQKALYAIGRTIPGKKITHAKAGQSIHNYGFAIDICLLINNTTVSWDTAKDWDTDTKADWLECVAIFAKYGWEWGGNWKTFTDLPHFEKKGYSDWKKLQKLPLDKNGYVLL